MQKRRFWRVAAILCLAALACTLLPACAPRKDLLAATAFPSLTIDKKDRITATVTLSASALEAHEGEHAHLFELKPQETLATVTFAKREPLASAKIAAEMTFTFDLYSNNRSRLLSSFVVCYEDGTPILDTPRMIDNPEILADAPHSPLWKSSPKGIALGDADTAASLGAHHASITVFPSALSTPIGADDVTQYAYDGKLYSLSSAALAALDKQVLSAYEAGMQVSLTFPAAHADLDANPNVAMLRRAALLDFLTTRYDGTRFGIVSAILIDGSSLTTEDTVRLSAISLTALRSRVADGRVYVISPEQTVNDALTYFERIGARLQATTAQIWGAAIRFAPSDKAAWESADAGALSPLTLKSFSASLARQANRPQYLAVCDVTYGADTPEIQAASLAYAYAASVRANVNLFLYGALTADADGLFSTNGTHRPAAAIFERLDLGLTAEQIRAIRTLSDAAGDALESLAPSVRTQTGLGSISQGSGKETLLFDFGTGERLGFSAVGGSNLPIGTNPQSYPSGVYNSPVLYTWLNSARHETGVRRILSSTEALENISLLSIHLKADYTSTEINACTLTLRLQGLDHSGNPLLLEIPVAASVRTWQTVTFNVAKFTSEVDLEQPTVLTLLVSPDTEEEVASEDFGLWIKSVSVYQPRTDHSHLWLILIPTAVVILTFLAVFLLYHRTHRTRRARR